MKPGKGRDGGSTLWQALGATGTVAGELGAVEFVARARRARGGLEGGRRSGLSGVWHRVRAAR